MVLKLSASHLCWPGTLAWRQAGTRRGGPPRTSPPGICLPHLILAGVRAHPSPTCSNLLTVPHSHADRDMALCHGGAFPGQCAQKHRISVSCHLLMFLFLPLLLALSRLSLCQSLSCCLSLSLSDRTLTPTLSSSFESPHSGPSTCSGNHSHPWPPVSIEAHLSGGIRRWSPDRWVGGSGSAVLAS